MKLNRFQFHNQHKRKLKNITYTFVHSRNIINMLCLRVFTVLDTRVPIVQLATFQIVCQLESILFTAMRQILHGAHGVHRGLDHTKKVYLV